MGRPRKAAVVPVVPEVKLPTIGSAPLVREHDPKWSLAFQSALIGKNNPMWNDQQELQIMASVGFNGRVDPEAIARALSFTGSPPVGNAQINERFSKRHTVADLNIPRNPEAMMQLSMRYAMENPFVAKACMTKTNFTVKDFQHETHNKAAKEFYDDYAITLRLKTQLARIVWSLYSVGMCPVYWGGEEGGPITFMQVINPLQCHFIEILGRQKLYLKIDDQMVQAVRDPQGKDNPANKNLYDSMPRYWIDKIQEQIRTGKSLMIELQDGSYTVLENRYVPYNRAINTLDGVPLQAAFDSLQRYRLFSAGDFAVAWNVKNMLTLISEGDPKAGDGKSYTPADDLRLQKLQAQFQHPDLALTIFCDPTTDVRYVVPPLEVFKTDKYVQCEKEIKEVLNLPSFMWSNDGKSTFGAAVAEVELLRQEVEHVRMLLEEQLFRPLYARLRAGSSRPGFAVKDIVMPKFDQNSLHDQVAWLQNAGELYSRGAISLKSYMEVSGLDFNYEMKQKEIEHDKYGNTSSGAPGEPLNNSPARPLFEPSQGNMNPIRDKGGNEASGSGNPDDGKATPRRPRPSKS